MLKRSALLLGGLILAAGAIALPPHKADARVFVGVGIGVPFGYGYPYGYAPYYYGPPVVYAPPPVYYTPPVSYVALPQQSYYYCDNPRGYYPSVQSCSTAWREVPASPAPASK